MNEEILKMKEQEIRTEFQNMEFTVSNYMDNLERMNNLIQRTQNLIDQKQTTEDSIKQHLQEMIEEDAPQAEILRKREELLSCRTDISKLKELQTGLVVECRKKAQDLLDFKRMNEEEIAGVINEKLEFEDII